MFIDRWIKVVLFFPYIVVIMMLTAWRNRKRCPYWRGIGKTCLKSSYTPNECKWGDATLNCLHLNNKTIAEQTAAEYDEDRRRSFPDRDNGGIYKVNGYYRVWEHPVIRI